MKFEPMKPAPPVTSSFMSERSRTLSFAGRRRAPEAGHEVADGEQRAAESEEEADPPDRIEIREIQQDELRDGDDQRGEPDLHDGRARRSHSDRHQRGAVKTPRDR